MANERKIDLNNASYEELQAVSNVGEECAKRIVEERERRGGFENINELDSIGGFGQEAIQDLKSQAYV